MMMFPSLHSGKRHPGMTLMEVVIAIGVVAFVIPLILAATGSAGTSRRNAEADTRSVWIAREVQRELIVSWGENPDKSIFETARTFPAFATNSTPDVLAFDSDGTFLTKGTAQDLTQASVIPDATYLVAIHSEAYTPPNAASTTTNLSILHIRILHPAKAKPDLRSEYRYNLVTTKTGIL